MSPQKQQIFAVNTGTRGKKEREVIIAQFQEVVRHIFGDELVFAYIFGSFAAEKDKRYSDVDTLICVHRKQPAQVEQYLEWLFSMHEMFGRIPDFKYPAEIVTLSDLQVATERLLAMKLSAIKNEVAMYDAMVWCHSLSQPLVGIINQDSIPTQWKEIFPSYSPRLLRSFLEGIEQSISSGTNMPQLHSDAYEIPREEPGLSRYIENLSNRGLLSVLKMIPFDENPVYTEAVLKLVARREFMGRSLFASDHPRHLYHPCFRFGVVAPTELI